MAPLKANGQGRTDYLEGWSEISRSMERGVSWSGHERNCAWLNAQDGSMAQAATAVGFDQLEDGRVVCRTDWDRDGDEDLWLRSRSGATLRFLENRSQPEESVALTPGPMVTGLVLSFKSGKKRAIAVAPTDGYLAAPSRRITIVTLPGDEVSVMAPVIAGQREPQSGEFWLKEWGTVSVSRSGEHLRIGDDDFVARPIPRTAGALTASPLPWRTVFRSALPIPGELLTSLGAAPGKNAATGTPRGGEVGEPERSPVHLIVMRSVDCPTCERVLPGALAALDDSPVSVHEVPVGLDISNSSLSGADAALREILLSTLGPGTELALPLSLLVDSAGFAHAVYQGNLVADTVKLDALHYVTKPVKNAFRTAFGEPLGGARWFHGAPRSFTALESRLRALGFTSEANFYAAAALGRR